MTQSAAGLREVAAALHVERHEPMFGKYVGGVTLASLTVRERIQF
jgi:hypothetical protein